MTQDERRAYVRGVLAACAEVRAPEDVIAKVCLDLKIDAGELEDLSREERAALSPGRKRRE